MLERYTEKARRVIFFARYEASQFGSPYIETEHLLLGLLREDRALPFRFLRSHASVESIRKQIEGHITIREKVLARVHQIHDRAVVAERSAAAEVGYGGEDVFHGQTLGSQGFQARVSEEIAARVFGFGNAVSHQN
jgi:ATP-dependent Clp protease ATP-binding subunit ClpA